MSQSDDQMIAALLRERQAYVQRDLPDRVAEVNAELKRLGHSDEDRPRAAKKTAAPKERASRESRQSSAD